jgi:polar amino acid transport system substrate-binding protein
VLSRRRLLALAGAGLVVAGCGRDDRPTLERLRSSGTARVGISGEQPFSYSDSSGRITGESPEVARVVLGGLGAGMLEAVQKPFGELIGGLLDRQYDLIAAGLAITPARCKQVIFSQPDFLAPTALLVEEGNPLRLHDFDDIARAVEPVAVLAGSVEMEAAISAGIPEELIETYDSQMTLVRAVAEDDVRVGALTGISLRDALRRQPGSGLEVTDGIRPDGPPQAGAFAFRPADTALRNAFDLGLAELQESGDWLRIAEPFGFTADNIPPPDLTTAELCRRD